MSVRMQEQKIMISAWMDGECSPEEGRQCLEAIHAHPELLEYWERCHSIQDIARRRYDDEVKRSLCASIRVKVEALSAHAALDTAASKVVFFPEKTKKSMRWMQLALAASVAFMAFIFVENSSLNALPDVPLMAKQSIIQKQERVYIALPETLPRTDEPLATLDNRIAVDHHGNMYLADHLIDEKQLFIQRSRTASLIERVDY